MAMPLLLCFCLLVAFLSPPIALATSSHHPFPFDPHSSISSLLDQNGLPIGLLPSSVQNFSFSDIGQFEVYLDNACFAKFDYQVYYAQTITGKLSYGSISELSGIQAKELFFWVPVTGIRVDIPSSGYIYFDVGPISKKLYVSQFEQIPDCKKGAMDSSSLSRAFLG